MRTRVCVIPPGRSERRFPGFQPLLLYIIMRSNKSGAAGVFTLKYEALDASRSLRGQSQFKHLHAARPAVPRVLVAFIISERLPYVLNIKRYFR